MKHEKHRKGINEWFPLDDEKIDDKPKMTSEEFTTAQRKLYQVIKQRNGRTDA